MGKSMSGAIWLDKNKTSPHDFFQYWRNIDDKDVEKCLKLLTFIDLKEINELVKSDINYAKEKLAYEVTKMIHGRDEAEKTLRAAKNLFDKKNIDLFSCEDIPSVEISCDYFNKEINIVDVLEKTNLVSSRSEARRLIEQGGIKINSQKILDNNFLITRELFCNNSLIIQKGKKTFLKIKIN
jgi:tyrosyl-tRNA synthetase